ncbi:MAG: fasciclin domain-containing protein [Chitinophagaceae bacterium]
MKKINLIYTVVLAACVLMFASCKRDYIVGGQPTNVDQFKNITSYDFLMSNPLFDTLVRVIDAAGLKDKVNQQNLTFFVPTDNSVYNYLNLKTIELQKVNPLNKFPLDSLLKYITANTAGTKDSLLMYMLGQPVSYSNLTVSGKIYTTELKGDTAIVSYEFTRDGNLGYNSVVSNAPQLVYFTHLWRHYDLNDINTAALVPSKIGVRSLAQTSGINTKTGILHILSNSNVLFFFGTRQ